MNLKRRKYRLRTSASLPKFPTTLWCIWALVWVSCRCRLYSDMQPESVMQQALLQQVFSLHKQHRWPSGKENEEFHDPMAGAFGVKGFNTGVINQGVQYGCHQSRGSIRVSSTKGFNTGVIKGSIRMSSRASIRVSSRASIRVSSRASIRVSSIKGLNTGVIKGFNTGVINQGVKYGCHQGLQYGCHQGLQYGCHQGFFFFFFFFAFPSYISGVHHFWVRFLRM